MAFEFRSKTTRMRWLWDLAFAGGSITVAFLQGVTVGRLVLGLPLAHGAYAGAPLEWFNPFTLVCGLGLCLGYALLGATWLIRKCEGEVRERAYRALPLLLCAVLAFLAVVFILALAQHVAISPTACSAVRLSWMAKSIESRAGAEFPGNDFAGWLCGSPAQFLTTTYASIRSR